jgi:putative ABC transport system substrate-binding protein
MNTRRAFLLAGVMTGVAPASLLGQPRRVRIGMLSARPLKESLYASGIVSRLAELGYREGSAMTFEFRSPAVAGASYAKLARELVELKCDLVFAVGSEPAVRSLRDVGARMPIVFLAADYDPVASGLVAGWSRPGGNITGVYLQILALVPKRMEILHEVTGANRLLVLADPFSQDQLGHLRRAADSRRIALSVVQFEKPPYDFESAFRAGRDERAQGLVLLSSHVFAANVSKLTDLASKHGLPTIGFVGSADAGGLLSYSVNNRIMAMRTAELGVRILKGAVPADTPIEQPDEFELVVNMKTANALGIKIPYSVLARATRLIQ